MIPNVAFFVTEEATTTEMEVLADAVRYMGNYLIEYGCEPDERFTVEIPLQSGPKTFTIASGESFGFSETLTYRKDRGRYVSSEEP